MRTTPRCTPEISFLSSRQIFFQYAATHGIGRVHKILHYKFLWLRLSNLTQDYGNCMGISYGAFFVICFCVQVLSSYGSLLGATRELKLMHVVLTSASLFLALLLLCICTAAQEATQEVSKSPVPILP
jgi:hypothetical protein